MRISREVLENRLASKKRFWNSREPVISPLHRKRFNRPLLQSQKEERMKAITIMALWATLSGACFAQSKSLPPTGLWCLTGVNQNDSDTSIVDNEVGKAWSNPGITGIVCRQAWSAFEPTPGQFTHHYFDTCFSYAKTSGKARIG